MLFLQYFQGLQLSGKLDVHWIVSKFNVRPWGNIGRDSRHEIIIESQKTSKIIIGDYLDARIREKVTGFPFIDVETNSGNMTTLQGTLWLDQDMYKMNPGWAVSGHKTSSGRIDQFANYGQDHPHSGLCHCLWRV